MTTTLSDLKVTGMDLDRVRDAGPCRPTSCARSGLRVAGAHAKEKRRNMQIECQNYAYEHAVDKPEIDQWSWTGLDPARERQDEPRH
jgi:hypothetical protein